MAAGRCSEAERDRIEEQVGAFVRTCTDNIARLEASVAAEPALNAHVVAHRHGAVRAPSCMEQSAWMPLLTTGAEKRPCQQGTCL